MINTGKVTNVMNEGNTTIVDVSFEGGGKKTVVIPMREDINKYKNKYVICGMGPNDDTDILEIVDD